MAAVVDATAGTANLYVDGVDCTTTGGIRNDFPDETGINLGRFTNGALFFKGTIDEARIATGACPPAWMWADWMTARPQSSLISYSPVIESAPRITAAATAQGIVISWPASGVGFQLYAATNLFSPGAWTVCSSPPAFVSGQWQVILPPQGPTAEFFRLKASQVP